MLLLLRQFQEFFNKRDFDFDNPHISLHDFHPPVKIYLSICGLWFNNKHSPIRFIWPFICGGFSIVGIAFESLIIYHAFTENDFTLFCQSFAYFVIVFVVPVFYLCIFVKKSKIYRLVETMEIDFDFVCKVGEPFRSKFLEGQLMIWKAGWIWMGFIGFVGTMFISLSVIALMYHCLFKTLDEESVRPLMFPLWLPHEDPYRSPLYEIFLSMMITIIVNYATTFPTYVYMLIHVLLHAYYMMDMVILGLETVFQDLDNNLAEDSEQWLQTKIIIQMRFRRIVDWHNGVFTLVTKFLDIYRALLAYQVIFSSIVMCLIAFYITEQLEQGTFDFCVTLLCIGICFQLWIPCYLGSLLQTKGSLIGQKSFYSGWHCSSLGKMVRTDLQLIMMRSQRPIFIQVPCLPSLQLDTFSSIVSSSYSYFNMLRQTST